MRYLVLACDYDGTLARDGRVEDATTRALERLRGSGRRLVLVTGRELEELLAIFPGVDLFDRVVAENGGVLYTPASRETQALAEGPGEDFVAALREHGVAPLSVGRAIVATQVPHETTVLHLIRERGLELQLIFNRDAVMVLPSGVNKATGLAVALRQLGLSPHTCVGVGDAENDHAFLALCECAVAVADAVPALRASADVVTRGAAGAGVVELVQALVDSDLQAFPARPSRSVRAIAQRHALPD